MKGLWLKNSRGVALVRLFLAKKELKNKAILSKDDDRLEKNKDFVRVEGFNLLRNKIRFCVKNGTKGKILVTSSRPDEGKSTCVCNLAISFARLGAKVLIIDCDLRKPVVHTTFGLGNKNGLSDVMWGLSSLEDCIQDTQYQNLSIISAGSEFPNPSKLLACEELGELLVVLSERYDYIIFDSAPINVVADAELLFEHVDGVVLVARYNKTTYKDLDEVIAKLRFARANLFGVFYYEKPMSERAKYEYAGYRYENCGH